MIFETKRLILREYAPADFDALYEILSDSETMAHYPRPYDADGVRRWITWNEENYRTYGFGLWAIVLKEAGQFIGDCGITMQNIDGVQLPELGYHIHKAHWQKGYAKEAARTVVHWFFTHTDFDTLYSYTKSTNTASIATAASVGMKKEKEYMDQTGVPTYVSVISKIEWDAQTARA